MAGDTMEAVRAAAAATTEVARRDLGDGAASVLSRKGDGTWLVERDRGGLREAVLATPYGDEAASVHDALAAEDPDWHRAYLPVGRAPVDRSFLTVPVHAVGVDVEACLAAFCASVGGALDPGSTSVEREADGCRLARFACLPTGTWFKASLRPVPGGFALTWWK